jgi:hypothetical protein
MPNCRVPNVADGIEKLRKLNPAFGSPDCRATVIGNPATVIGSGQRLF